LAAAEWQLVDLVAGPLQVVRRLDPLSAEGTLRHVLSGVRAFNRLAVACYGSTTADPRALVVAPHGAPRAELRSR
jgi:hypothetical protein